MVCLLRASGYSIPQASLAIIQSLNPFGTVSFGPCNISKNRCKEDAVGVRVYISIRCMIFTATDFK